MKPKKLVLSTYRPNFDDPRIRDKVKRVLEFCKPLLVRKKPKKIHSTLMTKVFGNASGKLASRLRHKLLQQESTHRPGVSSSTYTAKRGGYAELANVIGIKIQSDIEIAREMYEPIVSGAMKLEYSEPTPGTRRYHHVQNLRKSLRVQVFRGWFDYDIEAAAPTLLYQAALMAMGDAAEEPFPALAELVADRLGVRMQIAAGGQVDMATAKSVIVALLFGGRLAAHEKQAIFLLLKKDREAIERLKADPFVQAFQRDVQRMWQTLFLDEAIKKVRSATPRTSRIVAPRNMNRRRMAIYLQLERKVIDVMEDLLRQDGVEPVLIHDGFMVRDQLDRERLERAVLAKTGFAIRLAEAQLGIQPGEAGDDASEALLGFPEID